MLKYPLTFRQGASSKSTMSFFVVFRLRLCKASGHKTIGLKIAMLKGLEPSTFGITDALPLSYNTYQSGLSILDYRFGMASITAC